MSNNDILRGFDEEACDSLVIELRKVDAVETILALKLRGQIDAYSSLFFERRVKKAIDAGFFNLRLLLKDVDYVSSAGIGAFLKLQRAAREKGGDVTLVDLQPRVKEIFNLMCLEKFFSCTDTLDDAIDPTKNSAKVSTLPKSLKCPICERRLRAWKSGRFRCPECKTVLFIDETGKVSGE